MLQNANLSGSADCGLAPSAFLKKRSRTVFPNIFKLIQCINRMNEPFQGRFLGHLHITLYNYKLLRSHDYLSLELVQSLLHLPDLTSDKIYNFKISKEPERFQKNIYD